MERSHLVQEQSCLLHHDEEDHVDQATHNGRKRDVSVGQTCGQCLLRSIQGSILSIFSANYSDNVF